VLRHDLRVRARVRWRVVRDLAGLSSVTVFTMVGNAAVGRSDAVLIALFYGPRTVTVYVLTRRAAEMLSMFLARIGGAVNPGFAHLVGSGDRVRAAAVLGQVGRLYFWSAVPAVALYLALNRTFVGLWVGPGQFAGQALTVLVGLNVLCVGWAALVLYLLGGAGQIARSGMTVFVEALLRIALALALLRSLGLVGLPLAALPTTSVAGYLALGWLYRGLGPPLPRIPLREALLGVALLGLGTAAGTARWGHSWPEFVAWLAVFAAVAAAAVLAFEPLARAFARRLLARVRRRPHPLGA
jgi:O-antigen/teichoic acid export membrane protein